MIFRRAENPPKAAYGAWYFFPEEIAPGHWWNIFQFKTWVGDDTEPKWIVNVGNDLDGSMYLYLCDAITRTSHVTRRPRPTIPVGRWTHIEVYLRRAPDDAGRIPLWQDNIHWSINNYSDDLEPEDMTIFVDNADIVAGRTDVLP